VIRHFTATAFVVEGSRTLLHWHKRLQQWMPPGGHIEANEDPVQAVLREVHEETGIVAEVIAKDSALEFDYPAQLPAPYTILIEDIPGPDEPHKHIDLIYFCRPVAGADHGKRDDPTLRWVSDEELRSKEPLDVAGCGITAPVPEDVRVLALIAIETGLKVL
jgi:8-oxo-dGTP pyrophosphatase MutT (NUDIX family)